MDNKILCSVNCDTAMVFVGVVPETNFDFFYLNLC